MPILSAFRCVQTIILFLIYLLTCLSFLGAQQCRYIRSFARRARRQMERLFSWRRRVRAAIKFTYSAQNINFNAYKLENECLRASFRYADDGILTQHSILINDSLAFNAGVGVSIQLASGRRVRMIGVHLAYKSYGPYAANNKLVVNETQILAGEGASDGNSEFLLTKTNRFIKYILLVDRVDDVKNLLANERFQDWLFEANRQFFSPF